MLKKYRGVLIGLLCVAVVIVAIVLLNGGTQDFHEKYEGVDLTTDVSGIGRGNTYDDYLLAYQDAGTGDAPVAVDVVAFEGKGATAGEVDGVPYVDTLDGSEVTWKVTVEKAGMYNIELDYCSASDVESRGVDMEREIHINGELPFAGAATLEFSRLWHDAPRKDAEGNLIEGFARDNQGNEIRPSQVEVFDVWQKAYCKDDMGYKIEPYQFYFEAGENTITLKALNEPMRIRSITLMPVQALATYAEYSAAAPQVEMTEEGKKWQLTLQGERSDLRSTPSLYGRYDRSSPDTKDSAGKDTDVYHTVLNYIGGDPWNQAGQWIQWDFDVPEDGYYTITVKARQAYQRGSVSSRSLYIDGKIPFEEAKIIAFDYGTNWEMCTLSDEAGVPYRFFLTKGPHTLRLEATLGEMGPILSDIESSIYRLNQIYRKILVLTGVNPDRFRDYNIIKIYPEVLDAMELESARLYKLVDDTVAVTGQKSDRIAVAQTLAVQLENFVNYNERITQQFSNFKDNITSLGTAMQNMAECKLDVDLVLISGENAAIPTVNAGFFRQTAHEVVSCVASFTVDYNALGNKYEEGDPNAPELIEVWITTGRDQSNVLKTMIDDTFTPIVSKSEKYPNGIAVNVKLVLADTLLTAVVAGNGPDVVLSLGTWFPVNYAMRNAAVDLSKLPGYEEVIAPFYESAITPMMYEGGVYGLPETQDFPVLFYRSDILEELGLEVPNTWEDLIAMLPTIQGNNMSVGVPYPDIVGMDMSMFNSMIYQHGGQIYDQYNMKTLIDNEEGVAAFKLYTSLYNDYGLPTVYDFVSRFRSGEMPIGLANYSTYNTLAVSAPEIRGLWDFALYPGTRRIDENGNEIIDHTVHSQGLACMMVATDDEKIKDMAWEFMKWWVSTETQVRFGREIESILGSSARYTTANRDALTKLAWSAEELAVLQEQQSYTRGFPEIAGGYSTTRHMTNAIRRVLNTKEDPRETLLTYSRTINEEIKIKREEFNLPTEFDENGLPIPVDATK